MRRHGLPTRVASGFTLVELLVVITIIGILVSLLLPAVQAAREGGRRTVCLNNLSQLSKACLQHESAHGWLPTGGWGPTWIGDPDRGFSWRQPGGWYYNILPYMDQQALHDLGSTNLNTTLTPTQKLANQTTAAQTPVPIFNCPSRRRSQAYPYTFSSAMKNSNFSTSSAMQIAKGDYAMNGGDGYSVTTIPTGPASLAAGDSDGQPGSATDSTTIADFYTNTGVSYAHSQVQMAQIFDGASTTYLIGEKYMDPDHYIDGMDSGDGEGWDQGYENDTYRWTGTNYFVAQSSTSASAQYFPNPPLPDTPGVAFNSVFGSAHAVLNMAFCDGSVRAIIFSINPNTHQLLGNRTDHQAVDLSQLE